MIDITRIQEVLGVAGYEGVADNDPSMFKSRSPHTGRPIIIPLGAGPQLPETAVRHVLQGEPNVDRLILEMQ